jgi:hypothetical protein
MKTGITRRYFIQSNLASLATLAAFPTIVPSSVLGMAGQTAPNSRINLGCIGVGPQGRGDMGNFLAQKDTRVVALCDVAKRNLDQAAKQVNQHYQDDNCATYADFHELLSRKDVDAVLIATPDHWHVPVAIAAVNAGKDLYLEKPMGLTVAEDQRLRKAANSAWPANWFETDASEILSRSTSGVSAAVREDRPNLRLCRTVWTTTGGSGLRPRRRTPMGRRLTISRQGPGRRGGLITITPWASWPAGACTPWTSPSGDIRP